MKCVCEAFALGRCAARFGDTLLACWNGLYVLSEGLSGPVSTAEQHAHVLY